MITVVINQGKKEEAMKANKIIAAATGMILVASGLSACGGGASSKTADGRIKIVMWHGFSEADGKTLEAIAKDFNKSQKKYTVSAQLQPWSTIGETMVTKVSSGNGPDIVTTGADNGQGWVHDGTFQCVQPFYDNPSYGTKDYYKSVTAQTEFTVHGKKQQCAVPMAYSSTAVFYNTKLWKAAGLTDKDYPKTWDQFLDVAKKLTTTKNGKKVYGLALPDVGWAAYLKGNGTGVYEATGKHKVTLDSQENLDFLTKMRQFYKDGYSKTGMDDTSARAAFESGQAAMMVEGPWEDTAATSKGIDHDVFAVPNGGGSYTFLDGKRGSNKGSTGLYWWMTSQVKDEAKKKGIYEFFKYYNNHDNQVKWSLGSAYPPNNSTVKPSELSKRPIIAKFSEWTPDSYIQIAGLNGGFGDIAATLDGIAQNVARTNKDIKPLLTSGAKKIQGYINEFEE